MFFYFNVVAYLVAFILICDNVSYVTPVKKKREIIVVSD